MKKRITWNNPGAWDVVLLLIRVPYPVIMAFLAKGSESLGGILIAAGLFTRPASILIAFTMLIATVTANLGENFIIDGGFTISYILFSLILIIWNGGKYSLDYLLFRRKEIALKKRDSSAVPDIIS